MQGRRTGTPEGEKAARYIAHQLQTIDLEPMGEERSYFQWVPMHESFALPTSELELYVGERSYRCQLNHDYLLYKAGEQTFIPQPLPLIFVGYGIIAPEYDYNDYQSIDVEGKIVVFLSGEPVSNDTSYFKGKEPTIYSYPEIKQRVAMARGAYGSIMIYRPQDEYFCCWNDLNIKFAFEDVSLVH